METRADLTLVPGKLVREPPDAVYRVLGSELQTGEVVVALLETASEQALRSGGARIWVVLTDRRAIQVAADGQGDSFIRASDTSTVEHKGKLGRDEITLGETTLKCPLLRGGSEFKQFAALASAHSQERLRQAARLRLEEDEPGAAIALCDAGLDREQDPALLTIKVQAMIAEERYTELNTALSALVTGDPDLKYWKDLYESLEGDSRALWLLYQAAREGGNAAKVRELLSDLRRAKPSDATMAELIVRMDADEDDAEHGLDRAVAWRDRGIITPKTFLRICSILHHAGLHTERLHRQRALTLGDQGQTSDALEAIHQALDVEEKSLASLRVLADLLLRSARAGEAVDPLEQLLEAGQDDYWIRSKLGEGYEARERLDEAIEARELALERLFVRGGEPEQAASERRSLARLHRGLASSLEGAERDVRLGCADLLERGLDWAARLGSPPEQLLAGGTLEAEVEILAARHLSDDAVTAGLAYEEAVLDPKVEIPELPSAPTLLAGGIAGVWPPDDEEDGVVQTSKRSARVRYSVGDQSWVDMGQGLSRGLHTGRVKIDIPDDVRPTYHGERVKGELELEITPPGARFPLPVAPCHEPGGEGLLRAEEREGSGKIPLKARVPDAAWSLGETGEVEVNAWLENNRIPTEIEVAMIATERMRPPHKGEKTVETLCWTFPVFPYEPEERRIKRTLRLDLPRKGTTTGFWTWFELVWAVRVRLLRKERPEAAAEVPILLRFPLGTSEIPAPPASGAEEAPPPESGPNGPDGPDGPPPE